MKPTTFFITGTDTGVGKTVLTALLARYLRERGVNAVALKPICSGGRDDVRVLHAATGGILSVDEINPWHFRAPVAPLLAACKERRRINLAEVLAHIRGIQKRFDILMIEGAGGLLSPLGEGFNSRDLIEALRADPLVVCTNRLGVINQVLLTVEALSRESAAAARVVTMSPSKPDESTKSNAALLAEQCHGRKILHVPWLGRKFELKAGLRNLQVRKVLRELASGLRMGAT